MNLNRNDLDNYITGHHGEDQFRDEEDEITRLREENMYLQAILYKQATDAGYAYELMNSLLRGTIKVSNAVGRTAIRKAMARLIHNDAPAAKGGLK